MPTTFVEISKIFVEIFRYPYLISKNILKTDYKIVQINPAFG